MRIFTVLVAVLVVSHVWAPTRPGDVLWFGWIPFDLGFHLVWMAVAAGAVFYMTERVWPH